MNDFLAKLLSMAPQTQGAKFNPQDLLVPQAPVTTQPEQIVQEDPLANLEDRGYVPPTRDQQNSPGFKAAQNVFSGKMNSAPLVGTAPAEAMGAYEDRKPATLEDLVPSQNIQPPVDVIAPFLKQSNYQDAIARRDKMLQDADLREGAAGLAAALAGGKSQYSAKNLRDRAELETQDVTKGIEAKNLEELNNPGSDISKFAQERANSILKTINPESPLLGKLSSMTAQQLKTVFGDKVLGGTDGKDSRAVAAGNYVDAKTGQPLHFDEGIKKWVNGITGKIVDENTTISRPIAYTDPLTGGRGFFSAQGMVGAGGKLPEPVVLAPEETKTLGDFKVSGGITPKDTDTIDKDKEGFESSVKDTAKIVDGLTGVDALVDEALKNPNAYSSIGGIVGGLFEPGKLTDEDAKRYVQSSGILNRIRDLDAKYRTGKMDPGLAAEIKGTARAYRAQLEQIIKEKALRKAEATKKGLVGSARKEIPTSTIADYYYQPKQNLTGSSEMVKVISPDGKTGSIPKSNLEKALKKGYKEVQ